MKNLIHKAGPFRAIACGRTNIKKKLKKKKKSLNNCFSDLQADLFGFFNVLQLCKKMNVTVLSCFDKDNFRNTALSFHSLAPSPSLL